MIPGNAFACFIHPLKLIGKPPGVRIVVVVPVRDNVARRPFTAKISFVPDRKHAFKVNKPYISVIGQQIADVLPVCQDQQFRVAVRPRLKIRNRLRKPLSAVPRRT